MLMIRIGEGIAMQCNALMMMTMVTIGSIPFTTWHMGERPDFVDDPLFPHSPPTILLCEIPIHLDDDDDDDGDGHKHKEIKLHLIHMPPFSTSQTPVCRGDSSSQSE